jgi:phosphoglycolate phosphatase-like HAD superfamily hydrolase
VLILFDIDLTLVTTARLGMRCIERAGRELFGPGFSGAGVEFAGRLDPLIIADMLRRAGLDPTAERMAQVRERYAQMLGEAFEEACSDGNAAARGITALPGVHELLAALRWHPARPTLGVLTGNFEPTGTLKLKACGIDPEQFGVRVWGDDSPFDPPHRDHLPPVALDRDAAARGRRLSGRDAVIIGDTPHDVRCARVNGLRSLAVGTGRDAPGTLVEAGADWFVPDLSDTREVVAWLMQE